jgi:DNA-binding response OmpR family regulator
VGWQLDILVIEPLKKETDTIASVFNELWQGTTVISTCFSQEALDFIEKRPPQLVVLDLSPNISGKMELIRDIRLFSDVPIIILDNTYDEQTMIKVYHLGVDDYIVKPFKPLELLFHAKAIVRRARGIDEQNQILKIGLLRFDSLIHRIEIGDREVALTRTESIIMHHLMKHVGQIVSHRSLACEIWGDDYPESAAAVRTNIERLRKKLGDNPRKPALIFTETGLGYRFASAP